MATQEPGTAWGQGAGALRRRLGEDFTLAAVQRVGEESDLPFRHGRQVVGELRLHTVGLPPCRLALRCAVGPCLALPLAGELTLRPERRGSRPLAADAGRSAVLLPEGPFLLRCDGWVEVVLIALSDRALAAALEPWLGPSAPTQARNRLETRLARGLQWRESEALTGPLLALLHQGLRLLEGATRSGAEGLPQAGEAALPLPSGALQDCLLRPLTLLLLQNAAAPSPAGRLDPSRRIDALLEHIAANLHRPLSLRDLSEQSGCSPRTLQYAFERRFGCGPMQWVRQQRLEAAARALRESGWHEPVGEIARRCGYTNLSSFSRDIQRHCGLAPSALRQGANSTAAHPSP
ncbi:MAG: helix-turn-helix transcriptional regulator [Cyanobium sp.]